MILDENTCKPSITNEYQAWMLLILMKAAPILDSLAKMQLKAKVSQQLAASTHLSPKTDVLTQLFLV